MTLLFRILIIVFAVFQIKDMVFKKNLVNMRTKYNNLIKDDTPFNITLNDFDIAWKFYPTD
jgi:hypothetical protein